MNRIYGIKICYFPILLFHSTNTVIEHYRILDDDEKTASHNVTISASVLSQAKFKIILSKIVTRINEQSSHKFSKSK